jgi:hypothetical protein
MKKLLIAFAIFLTVLAIAGIDAAFTARSLLYSYRAENAYFRLQIEAQQRDINYLTDQYFELRELVRRRP